jgi:hypothetical protein
MNNMKEVLNDEYFNEFSSNKLTDNLKKPEFTGKRQLKNNIIKSKLESDSKRYLGNQKHLSRTIKPQIGGNEKIVKSGYNKAEKNSPFVSNDERNVIKKRQFENPPREPPVLLEQKIYDTSKAQPPPKPQYPPAYIPIYDINGETVNSILPYGSIKNPAYSGPIQKVYNISLANPLGNYTTINRVFEDVLPGDPRTLSYNSTYERSQLSEFIKNIILETVNGEDMNITGGTNSILSYIKLIDLNPYTLKHINPYKDLGTNFMLYRSAYPIRYNEQKNNLEIAKNSVGINVRLYNMTLGELNSNNINEHIDLENFDLWRDIKYYDHVKKIIKNKISPNFITSILYKIDSKSNIDWNKYNELKNKDKNNNRLLQQEFPNLNTTKRDGLLNNRLINDLHTNQDSKRTSMLNKKHMAVYCFTSISDKIVNEWTKVVKEPSLQSVEFILVNINNPKEAERYGKFDKSSCPFIIIEYPNKKEKYTGEKDANSIITYILTILNTQKIDYSISSNNTLVLLTEAPNNNIINWMSPIYEAFGTVKKMISTGYHSLDVWETIIFQLVYTFAVLQNQDLYFEDLSLSDNFYIKDLFTEQTNLSYWIYQIEKFNYYVPNYGYLVLFDSKYKDIENNDPGNIIYRLCSKKIFKKNSKIYDSKANFHSEIYSQFKQIIDPINFSTKLQHMGGLRPPDEILTKLNDIYNDKSPTESIIYHIHESFKNLLHNKIGTLLTRNEKEVFNILSRPILEPGNLIIVQKRYDEYEWVLYIKQESPGVHTICYKGEDNKFYKKQERSFNLYGYPDINKVLPLNTESVNYDEKNLIEKYNIGI